MLQPYKIKDRPTEMLKRQLLANRKAARWPHPRTGNRKHWYPHLPQFRRYYVMEILSMRKELMARGKYVYDYYAISVYYRISEVRALKNFGRVSHDFRFCLAPVLTVSMDRDEAQS